VITEKVKIAAFSLEETLLYSEKSDLEDTSKNYWEKMA
jgi:hypothetical protein